MIFVVSHILWRLNPGFRTQKKCPFSLIRDVPSTGVTNTKIMWTFFQDKILCPLNIGVPKEKFHCIRCFSKYCNKWWGYSEVATHWPPQLWWQHQISLCQLLWAHNNVSSLNMKWASIGSFTRTDAIFSLLINGKEFCELHDEQLNCDIHWTPSLKNTVFTNRK